MSSRKKKVTDNAVDNWVQALLPGNKGNNLKVGQELDKSELRDHERDAFYRKVKKNIPLREFNASHLIGEQSTLNQFREKLGQWHSAMLYADLLSYTPKNPDSERHLEQRMQALLREALVWFPDAIFAQVVLHHRGDYQGAMKECTAIAVKNESFIKIAEDFRKLTAAYAKENGTTVSFDIHLRYENRWRWFSEGHEIQKPCCPSNGETVDPRNVYIFSLPVANFYPGKITGGNGGQALSWQEEERYFFKNVAKRALEKFRLCKTSFNFGMLHIAQGVDVVFDYKDVTTVCHLYVMAYTKEKALMIDPSYNRAMTNLLSKLAHFFSIQRMLIQQKELEKQAHMLELVNKPLQRLGDALQASQQDIQEVYSIMHEPSHCIFAAQPKIAELFYDNQSLSNPDGTALTIEHQPIQYNVTNRKWVFAHALSRLRGAMLEGKTAEEALKREVASLTAASEDKLHVHHELSQAVIRLLNINFEDFKCSKETIPKYLTRLKDIMFTPFKAGKDALRAIELKVIIALLPDTVSSFKVVVNNNEFQSDTGSVGSVLSNANPFATQGHLLSFISDVILQHSKFGATRSSISAKMIVDNVSTKIGVYDWNNAEKATIEFTSSNVWLPSQDRDWEDFKNALEIEFTRARKGFNVTAEYGDFQKPFVKLMHRCRRNVMPKNPKFDSQKQGLKIVWDKLTLSFSEKTFSISSVKTIVD